MARVNFKPRASVTPTPMLLIATYNDDGTVNAMISTWSVTATWEVIELNLYKIRKTTSNIKKMRAFTVAPVTVDFLKQCDYLGMVTGKKIVDKVERVGLTPLKSETVNAPYFKELPLTIECELRRIDPQEDKISVRVLGDIKNVSIEESILKLNDKNEQVVDFEKLKPVVWDEFSCDYFAVGENLGHWFKLGKEYNKEKLKYSDQLKENEN